MGNACAIGRFHQRWVVVQLFLFAQSLLIVVFIRMRCLANFECAKAKPDSHFLKCPRTTTQARIDMIVKVEHPPGQGTSIRHVWCKRMRTQIGCGVRVAHVTRQEFNLMFNHGLHYGTLSRRG